MNQNAQMVDEELVDMETGEVVDAFKLGQTTVIEDLPRYARALRALEARVEMVKKYRAEETERIQAICDQKVTKFEETKHFLTTIASGLMKEAGKERLEYPGLGTFRFGMSLVSVNTDEYDSFMPVEKESFQSANVGWFRTKTTIAPDKKKIKATLDSGEPVQGFSLNQKHETFGFKVEK